MPPADTTMALAVPPLKTFRVPLWVTRMPDELCPDATCDDPLESVDTVQRFASKACPVALLVMVGHPVSAPEGQRAGRVGGIGARSGRSSWSAQRAQRYSAGGDK